MPPPTPSAAPARGGVRGCPELVEPCGARIPWGFASELPSGSQEGQIEPKKSQEVSFARIPTVYGLLGGSQRHLRGS